MSTVEKTGRPGVYDREDWKISSKGLEMLRCFTSGLDDIIIAIAIELARQKQGGIASVRLGPDEIRKAADFLFDHLRKQGNLPGMAAAEIEGIDECLKAKCQEIG